MNIVSYFYMATMARLQSVVENYIDNGILSDIYEDTKDYLYNGVYPYIGYVGVVLGGIFLVAKYMMERSKQEPQSDLVELTHQVKFVDKLEYDRTLQELRNMQENINTIVRHCGGNKLFFVVDSTGVQAKAIGYAIRFMELMWDSE